MTHLRIPDRKSRHRASACRRGQHDYGEPQNIGAGIVRQVCGRCGAVTIDLREVETLPKPTASGRRVRVGEMSPEP